MGDRSRSAAIAPSHGAFSTSSMWPRKWPNRIRSAIGQGFRAAYKVSDEQPEIGAVRPETPVPDVHAPNVVTGQYGSLF
jgi:hypothetical protein